MPVFHHREAHRLRSDRQSPRPALSDSGRGLGRLRSDHRDDRRVKSHPETADVASAKQAALGLFVADPSTTNHWIACSNADSWAACPLAPTVKARLADLTSKGYFGDVGGCGEEYISGTQNGFNNPPQVLSAIVGDNGAVTVVIQRSTANPPSPNFTAVMTLVSGKWLASDLASGTGANASIFSAKPNC